MVFVLLGLRGLSKDFFGAGNRNILQGAVEAIQRSKTFGMFDRANTRGTRSPKGNQVRVKVLTPLMVAEVTSGLLRATRKVESVGDE